MPILSHRSNAPTLTGRGFSVNALLVAISAAAAGIKRSSIPAITTVPGDELESTPAAVTADFESASR